MRKTGYGFIQNFLKPVGKIMQFWGRQNTPKKHSNLLKQMKGKEWNICAKKPFWRNSNFQNMLLVFPSYITEKICYILLIIFLGWIHYKHQKRGKFSWTKIGTKTCRDSHNFESSASLPCNLFQIICPHQNLFIHHNSQPLLHFKIFFKYVIL